MKQNIHITIGNIRAITVALHAYYLQNPFIWKKTSYIWSYIRIIFFVRWTKKPSNMSLKYTLNEAKVEHTKQNMDGRKRRIDALTSQSTQETSTKKVRYIESEDKTQPERTLNDLKNIRQQLMRKRKNELALLLMKQFNIDNILPETAQRLRNLTDCIEDDEKVIQTIGNCETDDDYEKALTEIGYRLRHRTLLEKWRKLEALRKAFYILPIVGGELCPEFANLQKEQDEVATEIRAISNNPYCLGGKRSWRSLDHATELLLVFNMHLAVNFVNLGYIWLQQMSQMSQVERKQWHSEDDVSSSHLVESCLWLSLLSRLSEVRSVFIFVLQEEEEEEKDEEQKEELMESRPCSTSVPPTFTLTDINSALQRWGFNRASVDKGGLLNFSQVREAVDREKDEYYESLTGNAVDYVEGRRVIIDNSR